MRGSGERRSEVRRTAAAQKRPSGEKNNQKIKTALVLMEEGERDGGGRESKRKGESPTGEEIETARLSALGVTTAGLRGRAQAGFFGFEVTA